MRLTDSAHARLVDDVNGTPVVRIYPFLYGDHSLEVEACPDAGWVVVASGPGSLLVEVHPAGERPDDRFYEAAHESVVTLPVR